jgi:hypothetical protein
MLCVIYLIILAGFVESSSESVVAEGQPFADEMEVLNGGEYVFRFTWTLTCQDDIMPRRPQENDRERILPLSRAVTSYYENSTALAVCFRENERKEIRREEEIVKKSQFYSSSVWINNTYLFDTKQRGTFYTMTPGELELAEERELLLLELDNKRTGHTGIEEVTNNLQGCVIMS